MTKQCPTCKEFKPETGFSRNKRSKDGLQTYCKPCAAAMVRAHKATPEGREKLRKRRRAEQGTASYKAARRERLRRPEVRKRRRELALVTNRKFRQSEKGKLTMARAKAKRRAKERALEHSLTVQEWTEIKNRQKGKCFWCHKKAELHKDHVIPVSKGGPFNKENIVGACQSCNQIKGAKMVTLF